MRSRALYTALLYAMLPYTTCKLLWRARRQPQYLRRLPERFGYCRPGVSTRPLWIHAVSVGETVGVGPLVRALREAYPSQPILLTHTTPTGWETGERLFGDDVSRCYLPYDFPWAVSRFLDRVQPACGVLMETEIWPNLVHDCHERGIPLYLVNARLSEKSYARYQRFAPLVRESLERLAAVAAQTTDDARRLEALGARNTIITGNLKFDITPPQPQIALGGTWRVRYGQRPVLLAASTRDGEEAMLLERYRILEMADALFVIVPRHPQRFDEVARLIERSGLRHQRRSDDQPIAAGTQVLLGDSMGEMFAYYAACDVAFVGGSLLPYGGQNLIEACAAGKPVLFGPHTYNFSEAAEKAVKAGAALRVEDAADLMRQARALLSDPERAQRMGGAGLDFVRAHQGATARVLELLRRRESPTRLSRAP